MRRKVCVNLLSFVHLFSLLFQVGLTLMQALTLYTHDIIRLFMLFLLKSPEIKIRQKIKNDIIDFRHPDECWSSHQLIIIHVISPYRVSQESNKPIHLCPLINHLYEKFRVVWASQAALLGDLRSSVSREIYFQKQLSRQ